MLEVLVALVWLALGAAALTAGAEAFAENVTDAAAGLGLTAFGLAVLLAGAEPEEAITGMLASRSGSPALAAGDAIGANLVILTLTLGLACLLAAVPTGPRVRQYGVAAAVVGALAALTMVDGVVGRAEGLGLLTVYVGAVAVVWRREQRPPMVGEMADALPDGEWPREAEGPGSPGHRGPGRPMLLVLLGVLGMVLGGALAVHGADDLVGAAGLTGSAVGLTLLAFATSAEMLALVWAAHRRGLTEIAVAAVVGAVVYNATATIGLAALVSPLAIGRGSPILTVAVATAALPLVLLLGRDRLPRALGPVLVVAYVAGIWFSLTA